MTIHVRYQSQIKTAVGIAGESFEFDSGANLSQLLTAISQRHGEKLHRVLLTDDGRLQPTILLFHGDEQIDGNQLSQPLRDGDTITFLAPMAGG